MKEKRRSKIGLGLFKYLSLFTFLLLLVFIEANAQVSNNSIHQSTQLFIDSAAITSTTDQSTVEWACINKKLTEKCLIYHNDQWFTFTAGASGRLYLNVGNQQCKKKFGVQVLLIEGNPCKTSTYKLLHCESFTDQNDTFISLDSIKANTVYLINIDGFLGDVCSFDIQLSTKPKGFPLHRPSLDTLGLNLVQDKQLVHLKWRMPSDPSFRIEIFEVYRQKQNAHMAELIATVPLMANAQGKIQDQYSFTDTLNTTGSYQYSIIGVSDHVPFREVLDRVNVTFRSANEDLHNRIVANVPLNFKKRSDVDLLIMNDLTGEVLFKRTCLACADQVIAIDLSREVANGMTRFRIELNHIKSKTQAVYQYRLSPDGELIRKPD